MQKIYKPVNYKRHCMNDLKKKHFYATINMLANIHNHEFFIRNHVIKRTNTSKKVYMTCVILVFTP